MASHRQGSGSWQVNIAPFRPSCRGQDQGNGDHKFSGGIRVYSSKYAEVWNRSAMKSYRAKRPARTIRFRTCLFVFLLLCVVGITILGGDYLSSVRLVLIDGHGSFRSRDFSDNQEHSILFSIWNLRAHSNRSTRKKASKPCEIDFLETNRGLMEPEPNSRFTNISLKYIEVEEPQGISDREPRFAGHQTLQQRKQSFMATDQAIHCGFVKGAGSSGTTGFDLAEEDAQFLSKCKIAISSCIFGSSDNIHQPRGTRLTGAFKEEVCFAMFVDEQSLDMIKQDGEELDENGYVGLWKLVVVRNMPYEDARRVGKIPKLLTHRLFPAARYSIWLDSKLRLQSDPILILEYFLWRGGHEYAISNHYDRHCVWEEVQQNKKLNKYNHTVIDEQFTFYQADGLTRFNVSDPQKLLPSHVPEGSLIIREHTPMSNLFSCLWFNEVERFTPRDQLSFAYTYMKFVRTNPDKHFYLNMFKDCERKTVAKLYRHRKSDAIVTQPMT